jgi:1-acyl-sn-glycerol-3-phosphate acyltransferase
VPVVPMAISGSREIMPPEGLAAASGEIRIRIDPPIATETYSVKDREMLKEKVREAISRNFELISKT